MDRNDLISRSELIKEMCVKFYTTHYYAGILNVIYNAPTVKSFTLEDIEGVRAETIKMMENRYARLQGEWIPVSERLPDKNGNYLCTVDYGENGVVVTQRNYWDTLGGFDKGYNKNDKVIAWQPLPEPYKKGKEE